MHALNVYFLWLNIRSLREKSVRKQRPREAGGDKDDANALRENTLMLCHQFFFFLLPEFLYQ